MEDQLIVQKIDIKFNTFSAFKIFKKSETDYILSIIFIAEKVTKKDMKELNELINQYNKSAKGLYMDLGSIDTCSPDVLMYNLKMIRNLQAESSFKRVSLCAGKLASALLSKLLAMKTPKTPTKVFKSDKDGLQYISDII